MIEKPLSNSSFKDKLILNESMIKKEHEVFPPKQIVIGVGSVLFILTVKDVNGAKSPMYFPWPLDSAIFIYRFPLDTRLARAKPIASVSMELGLLE